MDCASHPNADTCVIIRMFNEAQVVGEVIESVRQHFPHVLCVDDGSTDASAAVARAAGARVVQHPGNLGAGAALQTGIDLALRAEPHFDRIICFDADGQHRVEDAVRMAEEARRGCVDVVLGSRFLKPDSSMPTSRRLLLRAGVLYTRLTTGLRLTDTHIGLRVFNRKAAEALNLRFPGMAYGSELLSQIARARLTYVEVPVDVAYTEYSRSKGQPNINSVNIIFELMVARLREAR